jgi:hypothetical protein
MDHHVSCRGRAYRRILLAPAMEDPLGPAGSGSIDVRGAPGAGEFSREEETPI